MQSSDESDNAPAAGLNITDSSSSDEAAKERAIHPQPSLSRIVGTSTAKIDFSAVVNGGEVLVWYVDTPVVTLDVCSFLLKGCTAQSSQTDPNTDEYRCRYNTLNPEARKDYNSSRKG